MSRDLDTITLVVTTAVLENAVGLLAIHFPEKFHPEAWRAMPRSTSPIPCHEFSHERRAPSTGRSASTRAASSVTRSRRPRRSVTVEGSRASTCYSMT